MGCGTSAHPTGAHGKWNDGLSFTRYMNAKCPHVRLDHCSVKTVPMEGNNYNYRLSYVYVSQRGFYPTALTKANQDSYLVCENFLGNNSHFFGIFDGHGEFGDFCSHFAADQVPIYLEKELLSKDGLATFDSPKMEETYGAAFVKTNKAMHNANFDDSLSGTTAITIFVKGDTLYVANVGDSRAIIGTRDGSKKLISKPLSIDQTPFRKDERERLKKAGARILTLDQIEGNEEIHENWGTVLGDEIDEVGDPPRVWDHTLEKPGCAFTRSVGDQVAETCGVYAVPEILVWNLTPNDQYIVIASDGVFEFITSQSVIDAIAKFSDLLEAAKHIVSEAYRLWLTYDDRTDDITIIILSVDQFVPTGKKPVPIVQATSGLVNSAALSNMESKPVRRNMTKAKRKEISDNWKDTEEEFDFEANATEKSPADLARISDMLKANFMFQSLSPQQRDQIFRVMKLRTVAADELIIKEGENGDEMYVIDSGEFTVHKKDATGVSQLVFTYTTPGAAFGELSLMYGKPRAASVKAKTDGKLWCIGRQAFRAVLMKRKDSNLLKLLHSFNGFQGVSLTKLQRLSEHATEETFNTGEAVVNVNSDQNYDWVLIFILDGSLKLTKSAGRPTIRATESCLSSVEMIGFVSVVAEKKTRIARIPRGPYLDIIGELDETILRSMSKSTRVDRQQSIWSSPQLTTLDKSITAKDFSLESAILQISDYAYVGNFTRKTSKQIFTIKVIAKQNCVESRMDNNLFNERMYLAALRGSIPNVANVVASFQDDKLAYLVYSEQFVCDLGSALMLGIPDDAKVTYIACLYQALAALHDKGLIHRFVNPTAVYISAEKMLPVIADLRYAKKMDGSKNFTICGDPLYFAPEIVGQAGYTYAVDIWGLGIVAFELYEGGNPFGTAETEETKVFSAISNFKGQLNFSDKTPQKARQLISELLTPIPDERIGFKDSSSVLSHPYFSNIDWSNLTCDWSVPLDELSQVEISHFQNVEVCKSKSFDNF